MDTKLLGDVFSSASNSLPVPALEDQSLYLVIMQLVDVESYKLYVKVVTGSEAVRTVGVMYNTILGWVGLDWNNVIFLITWYDKSRFATYVFQESIWLDLVS